MIASSRSNSSPRSRSARPGDELVEHVPGHDVLRGWKGGLHRSMIPAHPQPRRPRQVVRARSIRPWAGGCSWRSTSRSRSCSWPCLRYAVANPDLPQYSGKAMLGRALTFPIAALLVPAVWWLRFRDRPYPVDVDLLFTAPFLIDVVGNALGLYDSIEWWDDANHFFNWMLHHRCRRAGPPLDWVESADLLRPGGRVRRCDSDRLGARGVRHVRPQLTRTRHRIRRHARRPGARHPRRHTWCRDRCFPIALSVVTR